MSRIDTSKVLKRKAICPSCGATNSQAFLGKNAKANDIWLKCKICKKEFELKI